MSPVSRTFVPTSCPLRLTTYQRQIDNNDRVQVSSGDGRTESSSPMHLSTPVKTLLILAFVAVVALGGVVGVAFARDHATYDIVPPNTYVDGVDISGMTEQQAIEAIDSHLTPRRRPSPSACSTRPRARRMTSPWRTASPTTWQAPSRQRSAPTRQGRRPPASSTWCATTPPARNDITMGYQVDTMQVRTLVDALAQTIDTAPADAYRDFNDDDTVTLHEEVWGHATDVDATTNAVASALSAGSQHGRQRLGAHRPAPRRDHVGEHHGARPLTVADLPPCIIVNYDTTMLYVFGTDPVNPHLLLRHRIRQGLGGRRALQQSRRAALHRIQGRCAHLDQSRPQRLGQHLPRRGGPPAPTTRLACVPSR